MTQKEFEQKLYRRLAQVAIGASAIRNQGASGLINTLRNYFEKDIKAHKLFTALKGKNTYSKFLDEYTRHIVKRFPGGAKS